MSVTADSRCSRESPAKRTASEAYLCFEILPSWSRISNLQYQIVASNPIASRSRSHTRCASPLHILSAVHAATPASSRSSFPTSCNGLVCRGARWRRHGNRAKMFWPSASDRGPHCRGSSVHVQGQEKTHMKEATKLHRSKRHPEAGLTKRNFATLSPSHGGFVSSRA
jgi:hypothetical protein